MSEFLNLLPLILGIIGTATGASAIVFSYLNYIYQKPNLDVKVKSFLHNYQKSEMFPPDMEILFFPILEIKNKGDRGTTMSKIELSFIDDGKKYVSYNPTYGKKSEIADSWGKTIEQVEFRWITPSETICLNPVFVEWSKEFIPKETIDCILTVFSTRKNYKVKITSKKVKPSSKQLDTASIPK